MATLYCKGVSFFLSSSLSGLAAACGSSDGLLGMVAWVPEPFAWASEEDVVDSSRMAACVPEPFACGAVSFGVGVGFCSQVENNVVIQTARMELRSSFMVGRVLDSLNKLQKGMNSKSIFLGSRESFEVRIH